MWEVVVWDWCFFLSFTLRSTKFVEVCHISLDTHLLQRLLHTLSINVLWTTMCLCHELLLFVFTTHIQNLNRVKYNNIYLYSNMSVFDLVYTLLNRFNFSWDNNTLRSTNLEGANISPIRCVLHIVKMSPKRNQVKSILTLSYLCIETNLNPIRTTTLKLTEAISKFIVFKRYLVSNRSFWDNREATTSRHVFLLLCLLFRISSYFRYKS